MPILQGTSKCNQRNVKKGNKNHKNLKILPVQLNFQILHQVFPLILIIPHVHLQGQKASNIQLLDHRANFC
jgi:hypothetical protein